MNNLKSVKLYYEDSFLREFEAVVVFCEPAGNGYRAVLNRTAFFAEGGGQAADKGTIDGIPVTDVQEEESLVWHYLPEPLTEGKTVKGCINWKLRFDRMQQHSGEHIISGTVNRHLGYDNVGFHLGADYCTMDFNGPIDSKEIKAIEEEANQAVFADIPLRVLYPDNNELQNYKYRSKIEIEGQVRLVEIPGIDLCACCAPHVKTTGQIGLIKITNMIHYKGGVRVTMKCGLRALTDYRQKQESVRIIGNLLCEKEEDVSKGVERLLTKQEALRQSCTELSRKVMDYKALTVDVSGSMTLLFEETSTPDEARDLMNRLLLRGSKVVAIFWGNDTDGYRYVIGSRQYDVRVLQNCLKEEFRARGGGKSEMIQGSLSASQEDIRRVLEIQ